MKDKVSIVIAIYNVEKYLEKCINSLIKQTYKNIEIILVDDGSTDKSPEICDNFKNNFSFIKVIHQKNGGQSSARNAGINISTGNFIMFVDGDDYVNCKYIEDAYNVQKETKADLVIFGIQYIDANGKFIKTRDNKIPKCKIWNEKKFWLNFFVYPVFCVHPCNKLYKKEIFYNLKFKDGVFYEDEFIIHEIISKCNLIVILQKHNYFYLQRTGSTMHTIRDHNKETMFKYEFLSLRAQYFLSKKMYMTLKEHCFMFIMCFLCVDKNKLNNNEFLKFKKFTKMNRVICLKILMKCMNPKIKILSIFYIFMPNFLRLVFKIIHSLILLYRHLIKKFNS